MTSPYLELPLRSLSEVIDLHRGDVTRPGSEPTFLGHYLKNLEPVRVPEPVDALIVPGPTPYQKRVAKRWRLFWVGFGIGTVVSLAYAMFLAFSLSNGQVPWQ